MKKSLFACAVAGCAAIIASSATATTFPTLTTIYVGAGVTETGNTSAVATLFSCANVSGQSASMRVLLLHSGGTVADVHTQELGNGANMTVATREIFAMVEQNLASGFIFSGTVNIESTQSAVFCTAMIIDPTTSGPNGVALHLVRVNPHPGTVE